MIAGIDPGAKGGVVIWHNAEKVEAYPMPMAGDEVDCWALRDLLTTPVGALCMSELNEVWIEKVHSMPKQGVASTFKFGRTYGQILGVCGALGLPVRLVTPQAWKGAVLAGTAKDKDAARSYVSRRWPGLDLRASPRARIVHDGMADALCIAAYGAEYA